MCRILSFAGKIDTKATASLLRNFRELAACGNVPRGAAKGHRDGWGIAGYEKNAISFFEKNPDDAYTDGTYAAAAEHLASHTMNIGMAHIRKSSVGKRTKKNTHPFVFHNIAFCHNGTIFNKTKIPLAKEFRGAMGGETDSERFFLYIMELSATRTMMRAIMDAVLFARAQCDYTALNLTISDGESLWALREVNTKNEDVRKKKLTAYYSLYSGGTGKNMAVCSEKIAGKRWNWHMLHNHELVQFNTKTQKRTSIII